MAARIQSPSSINTYKQCPRRYYYNYILKIEQKIPSIHLQRGKIAHSALEDFFKVNIATISKNHYSFELKIILQNLFKQKWAAGKDELEKIDLTKDQLEFYYEETLQMINNWFNNFLQKLEPKVPEFGLEEAFNIVKPLTEIYFISEKHQVRGFIDAIHKIDGKTSLIDYKTSKREKITEEYKLQLAIYALLYEEKYGENNDIGQPDHSRELQDDLNE